MKVTLLGASVCAPCKQIKLMFEEAGTNYSYLDAETDEGKAKMVELGARGVPILILEGETTETFVGLEASKVARQVVAYAG